MIPLGSPKRRATDLDSVPASNEVCPIKIADDLRDPASLAALRSFFELLDQWNQKENSDEQ
jgi:hypothetical protein